jgi:small nuclear ribonucleoprotein (snRNP)-like protein
LCAHKEKGCDWRGRLAEFDQHLNLVAEVDKCGERFSVTISLPMVQETTIVL